MLNATMIMDQKQAPGLIEVPCMVALRELAAQVPDGQGIVELGSYKGRSTAILALGSSEGAKAEVHAVDPWETADEIDPGYTATAPTVAEYRDPSTREAFEAHMEATGAAEYVTVHQATATDAAKHYNGPPVGLLFVDALHDYESVLADLRAWLPKMAPHAVVVLHDTDDVRYAVNEAAEVAFTRTATLRKKWAWDGREVRPWAKNEGKAPEARRRGFTIVRTR